MPITMKYLALLLSLAGFASFSWAFVGLFSRCAGVTLKLKMAGALGVVFSIAQILVIAHAAPRWGRSSIALVLYAAALAIFWWAVPRAARAKLSVAFADTTPTLVLTEGPYAYVRHPFYASYLLYWLAGAAMSAWLWLAVLIMGSFYVIAILQEENRFRQSPFAASYEAYRHSTGALFPAFRKMRQK